MTSKLIKFGTENTGYTPGDFGPFKCETCKYSSSIGDEDYHICENSAVQDDKAVPEDAYGNKKIEPEACCNHWTPPGEE